MSLGRGSPVFAIVLCSRRGEQRCYPAVKVVSDPLLKRTGTITGRHCTAIPVFFLISAALCCFLISSLFRLRWEVAAIILREKKKIITTLRKAQKLWPWSDNSKIQIICSNEVVRAVRLREGSPHEVTWASAASCNGVPYWCNSSKELLGILVVEAHTFHSYVFPLE